MSIIIQKKMFFNKYPTLCPPLLNNNTILFLIVSMVTLFIIAVWLNYNNKNKYFNNKTLFTIILTVILSLILLIYGLHIFSYAYKFYKLMQILYMENNTDSEKQGAKAKARTDSKKKKSMYSFGGDDSDDSDDSGSTSKKRKRDDSEEINSNSSKKRKKESFLSEDNLFSGYVVESTDLNKDTDTNNSAVKSTISEVEPEFESESESISYEDKGKGKLVAAEEVEPEFESESIPYEDKGKGKLVAAEEDSYVDVPAEHDDPSAWLSEEDLMLAKLEAIEYVKISCYEAYLEADNSEYGPFLIATKSFQDIVDSIKYETKIPVPVNDYICQLARNTVYWSEVVNCFEDKYSQIPDDY